MNANEILFRCSSLGYIMTEPKTKSETLSETAKTHCIDVFVSNKYGRSTDIENRYTRKGLMVEEDSITLFSSIKKRFYKKNEDHLSNGFIKGTPDLYSGESVVCADIVIDVKSSWDIFTFFRNSSPEKINKNYYWQLMGYMALTGAKEAILAYCLVNTPDILINDEKRRLMWKMGVIDDYNALFEQACKEIDRQCIYDDIPASERIIEISIKRDDAAIQRIYDRVIECRKYMNEKLFNVIPEREDIEL